MVEQTVRVGILGATGAVGQNYALLLENHPWFKVTYVAASPQSAGKSYAEAVQGKWHMNRDIPQHMKSLTVRDAGNIADAVGQCDFVFSSYDGSKDDIQRTEMAYAQAGIPVISNNSAHRWTEDVPMIIPEVNSEHIQLIKTQRRNRGFSKGFVVVKPNCSIQSYVTPLDALIQNGYQLGRIIVVTEQAISGAGYPGVASLDIADNVVPYIKGEDEKTEQEPLKVLGSLREGKIELYQGLKISATCTRVPVTDGHTAIVNVEFKGEKPTLDEMIRIWTSFSAEPQRLNLPSAPLHPIMYRYEDDRPQPRKDRDNDKGMAVTVGRLRQCNVLDAKFVGLSHNTIRGAAGGAILTAELLTVKGYLMPSVNH